MAMQYVYAQENKADSIYSLIRSSKNRAGPHCVMIVYAASPSNDEYLSIDYTKRRKDGIHEMPKGSPDSDSMLQKIKQLRAACHVMCLGVRSIAPCTCLNPKQGGQAALRMNDG